MKEKVLGIKKTSRKHSRPAGEVGEQGPPLIDPNSHRSQSDPKIQD
jgi:hypothetical protein